MKNNNKSKHHVTKWGIMAIILFILGILFVSLGGFNGIKSTFNSGGHKQVSSTELMRQGNVTKEFKNANFSSNVIFYDAKTTPDIAKADFDTSVYRKIDFLLYSDACPRCNEEKAKLKKNIADLDKKGDLIVLINDNQNIKPLRKHFKFPKDYRFPTLLQFEKDNDGKIILVNQRIL